MVDRNYFKDDVQWDGTAAYNPQFKHMPDLPGFGAAEGLTLRPFWGKNVMASYATFDPGTVAPTHQHDQEQLTLVITGRLKFTVGNQTQWIGAGDVVSIPPMVPHSARAGDEGATAVDMFSPPREGFRELIDASQKE